MYKLENRIGLRQFNVIKEHFFKVINRHFFRGIRGLFFNVIRGLRPANLDPRVKPVDDSKVECVTSGNDICCSGRSMIEMLGVLSIIGLLSVGGIAGYSKAMEKWKINKTIEQITQITHNIFSTYVNQKTTGIIYSSDRESIETFKTLSFISDDMIINNELKNLFGGKFELNITTETNMGKLLKYIDFGLYGIPKDACLTLGTTDWTNEFPTIMAIGLASDKNDVYMTPGECFAASYGNDIGTDSWIIICNPKLTEFSDLDDDEYKIPFPIPLNVVAEHCNCKDSNCYFGITISL